MDTLPATETSLDATLDSGSQESTGNIQPVVFVPCESLPNCERKHPEDVLKMAHFDLAYYKASGKERNGYFEFVSPEKPDQKMTLYQSGLRSLIKNLPLAFTAAKSLEANPELQNDNNTIEVCVINNFNGMSTRLVVNSWQGQIFIYMKLFTSNEKGDIFPTRKSVQISTLDDMAALASFVKERK